MSKETLGFIGVGHMGEPMAHNLLQAGFSLRVFDRDPARSAMLASMQSGAQQVVRPVDAAEPGGIVISMVPNDTALEEIVTGSDGILQGIGPNGIHLSMSTVSIALTDRLTDLYAARGSAYLAATVSGRPDVAEAKQLSIFYAGPQEARKRVLPILQSLGNPERIYDLGERPASAAAVKIAFNYPIPLAIMAMAGAATLAEKFGVPRPVFLDMFLKSPLFSGNVYQGYGAMIAADEFEPSLFPVELGIKDLDLMLNTADRAGISLPPAELYRDYLLRALDEGWGAEDWSVAARVISKETGLVHSM